MNEIPLIKFKVPAECVICGVREDSSDTLYRLDLNEFDPKKLSKLPGKYLGQFVHKDKKCLEQILKITNA